MSEPLFETQLFLPSEEKGGAPGHPYHVAAAISDKGTIAVLTHRRTGRGWIDHRPGHIEMTRSEDYGRTWSPPETVVELGPENYTTCSMVYDSETHEFIALLCSAWCHGTAMRMPNVDEFKIIVSADDGKTWQLRDFVRNNDDVAHGAGNSYAGGLQLKAGPHKGRLLLAVRAFTWDRERSKRRYAWELQGNAMLYSDDHGKTWTVGQPCMMGAGAEMTCTELADGAIYANARNQGEAKDAWKTPRSGAISIDGGVTWTQEGPVPPYNTTKTNGAVVRYPEDKLPEGRDRLMAFVNPTDDGPERRPNHAVWFSYDNGESWPLYKIIWDVTNPEQGEGSGSGNQCILVLPDGTLLSLSNVGTDPWKPFSNGLRLWRYEIDTIEDTRVWGRGRVSAQAMDLCFYRTDMEHPYEGKIVEVNAPESGSARFRFAGDDGTYAIHVCHDDAKGGKARYRLYVAGRLVDEWEATKCDGSWGRRDVDAIEIKRGDLIMLTGHPDGDDRARFSWIEIGAGDTHE